MTAAPIPLSDGQLRALGEMAYHAAQLENMLEVILNELVDEDPAVGAALTARMSAMQRVEMIRALIPLRGEDELFTPLLKDSLDSAAQLLQDRNTFLHSRWAQDSGGEPVQVRGKRVSTRVLLRVSEEDLEDLARSMGQMVRALEIDWLGIVVRLGRTTPVPGSDRYIYPPDRWTVEGDVQPARSTQKTDADRYAEGKITHEEYLQRTQQGDG